MTLIFDKSKENTRLPDVMRASIHLFCKNGIDRTTIKDIAKEAGVAEGALYRHFKSKEDLAWSLFSTHLSRFTADLMAKVYPETSAQARIRVFVEESFASYDEDPELYSYLILREHSELDKYPKAQAHPGHVVIKIIEDGQKSGEIRAGDPMLLGGIFIGAVIRLGVLKMYGNHTKDLRTYSTETSDAAWAMLKATQ